LERDLAADVSLQTCSADCQHVAVDVFTAFEMDAVT